MAIRDQRIDIGYGVEKLWRIVYDYRSDPRQRLQTGFVQYDNNCIPVWRPYDPEDPGLDASCERACGATSTRSRCQTTLRRRSVDT